MNPLVFTLHPPGRDPHLAVLGKWAYRVEGTECRRLPDILPIQFEPVHAPSQNPGGLDRLVAESDLFAPLKPSADVLVSGPARSHRGPVSWLDTEVRVGPLRKAVRVHGDRHIQLEPDGRLRFSPTVAFEHMPLTWDRAYGGRDLAAEDKLHGPKKRFAHRCQEPTGAIAYPRNPCGRGFFLDMDRPRLQDKLAPNLEDPEDPVTPERLLAVDSLDWLDRPLPACYAPVDCMSFPRVALWLGIDHAPAARRPIEIRRGHLRPEDFADRSLGAAPDPRMHNCAPLGLSGADLTPGDAVSLRSLHPRRELWQFHLPRERPHFLVSPPGCGVQELAAQLKTVHIEPDLDRVTLTWTGSLEVAAPYPEEMCEQMERGVRWSR